MKSSSNQSRNIMKGNKGRFLKGRCNHCGKYGHKKADCCNLKNKQGSGQENGRKGQKMNQMSDVTCVKSWVIIPISVSVSQEEKEIQNSNSEHESSKCSREDHEEDDRKPAAKRIKRRQKMRLRVGLRKS